MRIALLLALLLGTRDVLDIYLRFQDELERLEHAGDTDAPDAPEVLARAEALARDCARDLAAAAARDGGAPATLTANLLIARVRREGSLDRLHEVQRDAPGSWQAAVARLDEARRAAEGAGGPRLARNQRVALEIVRRALAEAPKEADLAPDDQAALRALDMHPLRIACLLAIGLYQLGSGKPDGVEQLAYSEAALRQARATFAEVAATCPERAMLANGAIRNIDALIERECKPDPR